MGQIFRHPQQKYKFLEFHLGVPNKADYFGLQALFFSPSGFCNKLEVVIKIYENDSKAKLVIL